MTAHEAHPTTRLGRWFPVDVECTSGPVDPGVLTAMQQEIGRLEQIFDPIDPASEFSAWRRGEVPGTLISADLTQVLSASERFWVFSKGAYHPGRAQLVRRWRRAEDEGVPPTREEMRELARQMELPYTAVNGPVVRTGDCRDVELSSLARGYILDRVLEAGVRVGGSASLTVHAAGDWKHAGDPGRLIDLAELFGADAGRLKEQVLLQDAALCVKAVHQRHFHVAGRRYPGLIDPRDGWPSDEIRAVATLAADALTADALADVIGVGRSLARGGLSGTAWLVVMPEGQVLHSENWPVIGRTTRA